MGEKQAINVEPRSFIGGEVKVWCLSEEVSAVIEAGDVSVGRGGDGERGRLRDMVASFHRSFYRISESHNKRTRV